MFTLLAHHPSSAGLDVLLQGSCTDEDVWTPVPKVSPHQIVLQVGQQTQRVTNDAFRATVHRVRGDRRSAPGSRGRIALIAFFRLGLSTSLAVPPSLRGVKNDAGAVYAPCTVEEFMAMERTDAEGNAVKLTSTILKGPPLVALAAAVFPEMLL